jgi:hypothetical protein
MGTMLPIVAIPLVMTAISGVGPLPGMLAAVGCMLLVVRKRRSRSNALLAQNEKATELLERGELDRAADLFDRLAAQARSLPWIHTLLIYNRGCVDLYRGDFETARDRFLGALGSGWLRPNGVLSTIAPKVHARLATASALAGRLDEAKEWSRAGKAMPSAVLRDWLLPDAIVLARDEDWSAVIRLLDEGWRQAEGGLTVGRLRELQVLKAFALEQTSMDHYRSSQGEGEIKQVLAGVRAGQLDYLARHWPALEDFLRRRSLLVAP